MKSSIYLNLAVIVFFMFACKSSKIIMQAEQPNTMKVASFPIETVVIEMNDDKGVVLSGLIEEQPLFDGNDVQISFKEYVNKNLIWTQQMDGMSGRVIVEFIVETDGSISNAKVIRGLEPVLDNEALRVINNSPAKWTPAKQRGKPVRFMYVFPVIFKLTSE